VIEVKRKLHFDNAQLVHPKDKILLSKAGQKKKQSTNLDINNLLNDNVFKERKATSKRRHLTTLVLSQGIN